jgi:ABC-type nickel/cobalt efflux system permease component RcnA
MAKHFVPLLALAGGLLYAHPMGNFSVSHYAKFVVTGRGVELTYVLDLAELPTFDLLRQWGLERTSPRAALESKAAEQAREWSSKLQIAANGKPVTPKFVHADFVIADGAGNLPIVRITSHLKLDAPAGTLTYEDPNFDGRAGWKEIVIDAGKGASLSHASQDGQDRSKALSEYPPDPTIAPPQDLRATLDWKVTAPMVVATKQAPPVIAPIPQPKAPPAVAPATTTPQAAPPGAVVKGDYLSRLLHHGDLTMSMILIAIVVAFGLGAAHALTPGHGKTIVAGSRGTLKHAAFLGAMVTFTHTISVFALGLATLFLFRYVMPEKITEVLGAISGLSIVAIGAWMLYKRWRAVSLHHDHEHAPDHHHDHDHVQVHDHVHDHEHVHAHAHPHDHGHEHPHVHVHDHHHHDHEHEHHHHDHDHPHVHEHVHSHGPLVHSHGPGGHVHSHEMPDEISWGSLIALGASGGLVPCESALVLLLSAIALGRVGLGLLLLLAFSAGLAIVLMAIGVAVIYAKNLLPERARSNQHPAFRWIPVASAAIVMCVGFVMTAVSLGWLGTKWMI